MMRMMCCCCCCRCYRCCSCCCCSSGLGERSGRCTETLKVAEEAKRRLGERRESQALPLLDVSAAPVATPRNGEGRNSHAGSRTHAQVCVAHSESYCHPVEALITGLPRSFLSFFLFFLQQQPLHRGKLRVRGKARCRSQVRKSRAFTKSADYWRGWNAEVSRDCG